VLALLSARMPGCSDLATRSFHYPDEVKTIPACCSAYCQALVSKPMVMYCSVLFWPTRDRLSNQRTRRPARSGGWAKFRDYRVMIHPSFDRFFFPSKGQPREYCTCEPNPLSRNVFVRLYPPLRRCRRRLRTHPTGLRVPYVVYFYRRSAHTGPAYAWPRCSR